MIRSDLVPKLCLGTRSWLLLSSFEGHAMGMDQSVTFKDTPIPTWEAVSTLLSSKGYPVQMRMIDGQLAFPDEQPPDDWKELRVGTPQGMITIRREPQRLVFVTWGNADAEMLKAWNALTWAFAEVGN